MLEELPFPFPLDLELEEKPQASSSGSLMVLEEGAATRLRESPPVEVIACISVGCELRIVGYCFEKFHKFIRVTL